MTSPFAAFLGAKKRPPGRTILLEPWVFRDTWPGKPTTPICVGLRLVADADKARAKAEAERIAREYHSTAELSVDAFNDALMRQLAAAALCDPNDVEQPVDIMELAEDAVEVALTSRGARLIFDALERYEIESSPLHEEADAEDINELSDLLMLDVIDHLPPEKQGIARKLARYLLDELRQGNGPG